MDSELKQKLKSLCWINGWSYGIFWCFDQRNPMLLTVEDAYCEEQMQAVIDDMLLQAHTLGQGIIGQTALTMNPQWLFLDAAHDIFQDESEFLHQFMCGIKTILVIPMGTQGVLQFGSTRRVPENSEILNQAKSFFKETDYIHRQTALGNTPSLVPQMFGPDGLFASVLSSESPNNRNLEQVISHKMNSISVHDFSQEFKEDNSMTNLYYPKRLDHPTHMGCQSEDQNVVALIKDDDTKSLQECSVSSMILRDGHQERSKILKNSGHDLFESLRFGYREQHCNNISSLPEASGTRKELFSEYGLDDVSTSFSSNSSSITSCRFENHFPSPKRRRIESTASASSCWMGAERTILSSSKKLEGSIKVTKKRAKPGEGTRPRPRDRQLIQDRIKELRKIIPRGAKCSIDALLDLTVKHMIFLQSVTERLKQCHDPKPVGIENGPPLDENTRGGNGATWAYEMGDKTMFCPIIVKDITPPGHMLIEMLCEERGCFLEMVGVIKDLGVSILKGAMEIRDGRVWAHFIVEADRKVTRQELFWSLAKLLIQSEASGIGSTKETRISPEQTSLFPVPVSLVNTRQ